MSMFSLSFDTNNASFKEAPLEEIAATLEKIAQKVREREIHGIIRDTNGNQVGNFVWSRSKR